MCVNYQRLLRRLDKKLADKERQPFCPGCWKNLNTTMTHHRSNQTQPSPIDAFSAPVSEETRAAPPSAIPVEALEL